MNRKEFEFDGHCYYVGEDGLIHSAITGEPVETIITFEEPSPSDAIKMFNIMNQPPNLHSHYRQGSTECIDAIKASMTAEAFQGYLTGNAIKYLWRYKLKGTPLEDIIKCKDYVQRLQNELENNK